MPRKLSQSEKLMALKIWGMPDQRPTAFLDGFDSYAEEYKKIKKLALAMHRSLLRIFECDDVTFYDRGPEELLARHSLGEYKRVIFRTLDTEDVVDEETRGANGLINEVRPKVIGVTGNTTCVESNGDRRSIICMRNGIGEPCKYEVLCGMKIGALLHEIGHVDDMEKGINWKHNNTLQWVAAEAYAHHFACSRMVASNYFVSLAQYLREMETMKTEGEKHARLGAAMFLDSPEAKTYRNELQRIEVAKNNHT